MYRYKYNTSYHHKSRRARRSTVFASVFVLAVVGIAGYIIYDIIKQNSKANSVVSQPSFSSVQGASVNLFRTSYFQFQADDGWKEIPSESKEGHYVYRKFKGPLVEHDLVVDVNQPNKEVPALSRTNHVMAVEVDSTGRLNIVSGAGEHCNKQLPKETPNLPLQVTQKQVSFICNPDAVLYEVKLGVVGGSTQMQLPRPDGSRATYAITYRNLKFTPDDSVLRNIIDTFQTR